MNEMLMALGLITFVAFVLGVFLGRRLMNPQRPIVIYTPPVPGADESGGGIWGALLFLLLIGAMLFWLFVQ